MAQRCITKAKVSRSRHTSECERENMTPVDPFTQHRLTNKSLKYLSSNTCSGPGHAADPAPCPRQIRSVQSRIIFPPLLILLTSMKQHSTAFITPELIFHEVCFLSLLSAGFLLSSLLASPLVSLSVSLPPSPSHTNPSFSCFHRLGKALDRID